jgi:hypothetical protein
LRLDDRSRCAPNHGEAAPETFSLIERLYGCVAILVDRYVCFRID